MTLPNPYEPPAQAPAPTTSRQVLTVEKFAPGGQGFGRLADGRVAFVDGAVPGDVIAVDSMVEKSGYVRVTEWELTAPAAQRRAPPCAVAEACGACGFMALGEAEQRQAKRAMLVEALERTGRFREGDGVIECVRWAVMDVDENVESAQADATAGMSDGWPELHYRQRARLHFDSDGNMGFFARGSHRLIDAGQCVILSADLERAVSLLERVRQARPHAFAAFSDVEVRAYGEQRSLHFVARTKNFAASKNVLAELARDFAVTVASPRGKRRRGGQPAAALQHAWKSEGPHSFVRLPLIDDVELLAAPSDFTQVNWVVNRAMLRELVHGASERGVRSFLDLYCGAGNFSLPLLHRGLEGLAMDSNTSAIASARQAAAAQGLNTACFECRDVEQWLGRESSVKAAFDLLIADPPRAGLGKQVEPLFRLAPAYVFLCACDPVPFARDLRRIVDLGWEVESLTLYDMFPQTHHFELTAWLRASRS